MVAFADVLHQPVVRRAASRAVIRSRTTHKGRGRKPIGGRGGTAPGESGALTVTYPIHHGLPAPQHSTPPQKAFAAAAGKVVAYLVKELAGQSVRLGLPALGRNGYDQYGTVVFRQSLPAGCPGEAGRTLQGGGILLGCKNKNGPGGVIAGPGGRIGVIFHFGLLLL